jgi:hypothetical protein
VTGHLIGSLCSVFGNIKVHQLLSMHPSQGYCVLVMFDRIDAARAAYRSLHRMMIELDGGDVATPVRPQECTLCLSFVAPNAAGQMDVRLAPPITARLKGQRPAETHAHAAPSPIHPPGGMAHFA